MSISPITFNGMLQNTNELSVLKQHEDNKPHTEQQMITNHQLKQEDEVSHRVNDLGQNEKFTFHYDAKEKGNGSYQNNNNRKKKQSGGKVIKKDNSDGHFDIKI